MSACVRACARTCVCVLMFLCMRIPVDTTRYSVLLERTCNDDAARDIMPACMRACACLCFCACECVSGIPVDTTRYSGLSGSSSNEHAMMPYAIRDFMPACMRACAYVRVRAYVLCMRMCKWHTRRHHKVLGLKWVLLERARDDAARNTICW